MFSKTFLSYVLSVIPSESNWRGNPVYPLFATLRLSVFVCPISVWEAAAKVSHLYHSIQIFFKFFQIYYMAIWHVFFLFLNTWINWPFSLLLGLLITTLVVLAAAKIIFFIPKYQIFFWSLLVRTDLLQ